MNGLFDTSAELELARRLSSTGRDPGEADRLARLVLRFLTLSKPPENASLFPRFGDLQHRLEKVAVGGTGEEIEDAFLELYAHVHMNEAPYTSDERRQMDEAGGYWNHAGGLSPILKAGPWINPDTISADFGAGNGLQGLLLQLLSQVPLFRVTVLLPLHASRLTLYELRFTNHASRTTSHCSLVTSH